ncbi:hypothetical protein [Paraburkholderia ferrariae]|uniref:hypothetical protein n=1 Tax=Paraburkholderia ferrariae TaxID=386056 RepID=UPI0004899513|nr:hypothetical protein [Paraburkholderia ferrariae]
MTEAKVLTHPAFDRPVVVNKVRAGRRPKGILNLEHYRRLLNTRHCCEGDEAVRNWARQNGLNAEADIELLRYGKDEAEAVTRVTAGPDRETLAALERIKSSAFALYNEAYDLRSELLRRYGPESAK